MEILKRLPRSLTVGSLAGLGIAVLFAVALPRLIDRIEYQTYYLRCQWQLGDLTEEQKERLRGQEPDVCLIDIDDRSIEKMGNYWGWHRGYHARMLQVLRDHYPAAVGFDITFDNPEDSRHMERFDAVLERTGASGELSERLRRRILSSIDYDTRFTDATRAADVVYHAIRMAEKRDYAEHALSQIEYRMQPEWHEALNPASALSIPMPGSGEAIRAKPILDGTFPLLARAARGIGHVNMVPNEDGVIREVPLLFRFDSTDAVYLPLSVRICATLFGTPNDEVVFEPGRHLDIGTPFKICRTPEGVLECSYPHLRPAQVRTIVERGEEILACPDGHSVEIATFAALGRDDAGLPVLRMYAGEFPQPVLGVLMAADWAAVRALAEEGEMGLGGGVRVVKEAEGAYVLEANEGEEAWYLGEADIATLAAVAGEGAGVLDDMREGLLYYPFTVQRQQGRLVSSIPVLREAALEKLCRTSWDAVEKLGPGERLEFGARVCIPLTPRNTHIVTYFGPARNTFKKHSYYAIMRDLVSGGLAGKIFLVGSTAPGLFDLVHAPVDREFPGIEVHASMIRSFLRNTFVRRLAPWADVLILVLVGTVVGVAVCALAPLPATVATLVAMVAYFLAAVRLFDSSRLWIEVARPLLTIMLTYAAVMAYRYVTEERDRKFLQTTFKTYLAPELIDKMYREKTFPKLGGEEGLLTAFFTDVQSFSTVSEKLGSPARLVELLNEYLTAMTDILLTHNGTLDKYEGDAILAFFGAPMPMADHAQKACAAALAMQRKLAELREKWRGEGDKWPPIVHDMRMRIGINTGPIVTGNMGSASRMDYTMMGDAVNLAARLESAAKQYGVYTMISGNTLDIVKDSYEVRQLDRIQVVGKSEPVVVYELLSEKGALPESLAELLEVYNRGLELFYARKWDEAAEVLGKAEALEPLREVAPGGMSPSRRLMEYCGRLSSNPPGPEWDGVSRLTSK